jgi:hypothetical protein
MRLLESQELARVSGAEGGELPWEPEWPTEPSSKQKNNNGYGNGAESGPPPGHSGERNPQLLTWNSGPRGVR